MLFLTVFDSHIIEICKTAFYHLRTLSKIRRYLRYDTTKVLINAFVISCLDNYCNSLMYGLPKYLIDKVQYVFNSPFYSSLRHIGIVTAQTR